MPSGRVFCPWMMSCNLEFKNTRQCDSVTSWIIIRLFLRHGLAVVTSVARKSEACSMVRIKICSANLVRRTLSFWMLYWYLQTIPSPCLKEGKCYSIEHNVCCIEIRVAPIRSSPRVADDKVHLYPLRNIVDSVEIIGELHFYLSIPNRLEASRCQASKSPSYSFSFFHGRWISLPSFVQTPDKIGRLSLTSESKW